MASIKPFPALRPQPKLAEQICELPYDVMSSEEARVMADGNALSFLHVSKPEIDLPPGTAPDDPAVYKKGGTNFQALIAQGALVQDSEPHYYLYRQIMGDHAQLGLVAAASCEEYDQNLIRKHEFTRPQKEDDRVRHMEALNAQTGPVFLTYRADPRLDKLFQEISDGQPEVDFTAPDKVRHTSWTIQDAEATKTISDIFGTIPCLYIADGHHRSAAAARVWKSRQGQGASAQFLTVIFPHDQMQILAYNRALRSLNGHDPKSLLEKLDAIFIIQENGQSVPARKHDLGFFLDGTWRTLSFRPKFAASQDPIEKLDVTLLQKYVLEPLFGIDDPRTSEQISFVGGIRGPGELEKLVGSGDYACAFSMFPTSIEDLMAIADQGGIMPPKSTWFEPKLRDGMFSHML